MTARPEQDVTTLIDAWRSLSAVVANVGEAQWKAATDVPVWTVQDHLSHIIGTERLLEGLPLAAPRTRETPWVKNQIGDLNENEVEARRDLPGETVRAEWEALRPVRERTLTKADADYFAQPAMTPVGPGTMADFLGFRILDCWIHEHDIRRALGRPGNLGGPAAEHTISRLTRSLPMVVGKRAACPEGCAVRVRIHGDVERDLVCEVHGGRAAYVDMPAQPPLAEIDVDTETFVVLATGRRPASELGDRITITGDEQLGQAVVDQLNVMT